MENNLLQDLSDIHDKCIELIDQRNHLEFNKYVSQFINEEDSLDKLNKLKTILVITKKVSLFFIEMGPIRENIKKEFDKLNNKF